MSMFPLRLYPWMRPEMLDLRTNPGYIRVDFIEKDLHLRPPLSRWVAWGLSWLVVPLLNGVGCIPAFQNENILEKRVALEQSLERLREGRCLLVFPAVPDWELDSRTRIRRFSHSPLWLAELHHRMPGSTLPINPMCIHPTRHIRLGQVVALGEEKLATLVQKRAWIEVLEGKIHGMYLEMEKDAEMLSPEPINLA
jgi:hypothetical protein